MINYYVSYLSQKGFHMKFFHVLKSWLTDGCILYTVISACFLILSLIMGDTAVIKTSSFALMIPCGLVISIGTQILRNKTISAAWRYLSHFLFTVLGIFLFLWLPADSAATPMAGFLMLVLFSVLYWLVFLLCLFIRSRHRKLMKED